MKNKKVLKLCCILYFLFSHINSFAQQIVRGFVVDSITQKPIEGAAIFFDKTTYGTISNKNGFFVLKSREHTKSPLIIRYLGYQPKKIIDPPQNQNVKFNLNKQEENLEAVVINSKTQQERTPQTLTDKTQKFEALALFKHFFLGRYWRHNGTNIMNEEELDYYITDDKLQIIITAKKPLIIHNNSLDYEITYYLEKFVLHRKMSDLTPQPVTDYYEYYGTILFKDLQKRDKVRKKYRKARNEVYYGSRLHFMRALAENTLEEEMFTILGVKVDTINIKTIPKENFTEVLPPNKFLVIHRKDLMHYDYKKKSDSIKHYIKAAASSIYAKRNFGIDETGNFFPWDAIMFEGRFSLEGISKALPIDFKPYP